MNWPENIINGIRAHAEREYPRESCGLIVVAGGVTEYRECSNLAAGQGHFIMDPGEVVGAECSGHIAAIVHSHPNVAPEPSEADRVMMERWRVPWLIVNWPTGEVREHHPSGYKAPLIGREFSHGVLDCFALIRDYYAERLGIELPDFQRPDDWWNLGGDLYRENYSRAGFVMVSGPPREHDVILMQLKAEVPNHAGIYLGKDVILHHVMNRLSRREVYSGFWERITSSVVRHRDLC